MSLIFISYRRRDSSDATGRLYDRLRERFSPESLFMDVDSIPPGVDFRRRIQFAITQAHIMLVVIGDDWINACDEAGRRRLDDPNDYVRIEIEAAFEAGLVVIPVLVRHAQMPRAEELPKSLHTLLPMNGAQVRSGYDFEAHVKRLITALEQHLNDRGMLPQIGRVRDDKIGEPDPGKCPKCGRRNPPERKFCGGCRESLHEPCFVCGADNGAWDDYCGDCGDDLKATRSAKLDESLRLRETVEQAVGEFRFEEAIRAAGDMAAAKHPRLRDMAKWATERIAAIKSDQASWAEKLIGVVRQAKNDLAQHDFAAAVSRMHGIPPTLRDVDYQTRLAKAIQAKSKRAEVEQRMCSEDLEEVLPSLQEYMSLVSDVDHIRGLLSPWLQRIDETALSHVRTKEFSEAVRLWELLPEALRDSNTRASLLAANQAYQRQVVAAAQAEEARLKAEELRRQAEAKAAAAKSLADLIVREMNARDFRSVIPRLDEYIKLTGDVEKLRTLLEPWMKRIHESAEGLSRSYDFQEAVGLWTLIPRHLRAPHIQIAIAEAERKNTKLKAAIASFGSASKDRDLNRIFDAAQQVFAVAPEHAVTKRAVQDCIDELKSEAIRIVSDGRKRQAIAVIDRIPAVLIDRDTCELRNAWRLEADEVDELESAIQRRWTPKTLRDASDLIHDLDRYSQLTGHRSDFVRHRKNVIERLVDTICRLCAQSDWIRAREVLSAVSSFGQSSIVEELSELINTLASKEPIDSKFGMSAYRGFERFNVLRAADTPGRSTLIEKIRDDIIAAARRRQSEKIFREAVGLLELIPSEWRTSTVAEFLHELREAEKTEQTNREMALVLKMEMERTAKELREDLEHRADRYSAVGMFSQIRKYASLTSSHDDIHKLIDRWNSFSQPISRTRIDWIGFPQDSQLFVVHEGRHLEAWDCETDRATRHFASLPVPASSLASDFKTCRVVAGLVDGSICEFLPDGFTLNTVKAGTNGSSDSHHSVAVIDGLWHSMEFARGSTLNYFKQTDVTRSTQIGNKKLSALRIFSSETGILAAFANSTQRVRIWDPSDRSQRRWCSIECASSISRLAAGREMIYAGCSTGQIHQYSIRRSATELEDFVPEERAMCGHVGEITALEALEDRPRLISAGEDRTVRYWDTESGALLRTFKGHRKPVRAIAISPDGRFAASGDDAGQICLWWIGE